MRYSVTLAALAAVLASPVVNADGLYSKGSSVLSLDQKGFRKLEKSYLPSVSSELKTRDGTQLIKTLDSRVRKSIVLHLHNSSHPADFTLPGAGTARTSNLPTRKLPRALMASLMSLPSIAMKRATRPFAGAWA